MIRDAVAKGASTPEAVAHACGAGTGCGGCKPVIEGLLVSSRPREGGAALPMLCAPERGV